MMKKITLLILLMVLPFVTNAQTFNFDTGLDGWNVGGGIDAATEVGFSGNIMTLTLDNDNNPNMNAGSKGSLNQAAIDLGLVKARSYMHFAIKNNTTTGKVMNQIRIMIEADGVDNGAGGTENRKRFTNSNDMPSPNLIISNGDAAFQVYTIDLSGNENWDKETVNKITIRYTNNPSVGVSGTIQINAIAFTDSAVPPTLSVEPLEEFKFAFYPNPSRDIVNFSSVKPVEQVQMYSLLGQEVLNVKLENQPNQSIDVSRLAVGIYNMKVKIDGAVGVVKFVKK